MKQFEIEIIDNELKEKFGVGVGFIDIVIPIEIWMKLPPKLDHKILFRDRTERDSAIILNEIYSHLIEQFKFFLSQKKENFKVDESSFFDEPIKLGNRSLIKILYYSKGEE
jgi:hypothetical protein